MTGGILKRLLDTDEVMLWAKLREMDLKVQTKKVVKTAPMKRRQTALKKVEGRLLEIKRLKSMLSNHGSFETESKELWARYKPQTKI